jgi:hypothetical protein
MTATDKLLPVKRRMTPIWSSLGVFLALALGCSNPDKEAAWEIIRMPPEQRGQALSRLPPEKQMDIFVYADTKIEPPMTLALEVASNWKSMLPVVTQRLASETDARTLPGLMMILFAVSANYCALSERDDVLIAASRAVKKIDAPYRDAAERQLKEITHPQNKLPPCR